MKFKLIIKKIKNKLTREESELFNSWLNESPDHLEYFNKVKANFNSELDDVNVSKAWLYIQNNIQRDKSKVNWNYLKAIAAVFIGVLITTLFFVKQNPSENLELSEIGIGSVKATLTLENGKKISLEKDKTYLSRKAKSNGETLVYSKEKDNKDRKGELVYNYLTIPRGGEFFVELSDGTKVWLNSDSKLRYPVNFINGKPREVELIYGEAYFEVSKSTNHGGDSFVLKTNKQTVTVLGTKFNVNAYREETHILTTLVEGSIAVGNGLFNKFLIPGQQSKFNQKNDDFEISSVEVAHVISWREGVFSFKNKSLEDIMKVLSRWYDVDIEILNEDLRDVVFTGVLRKKMSLERILKIINNTNNMSYKVEKKQIIIE